PPPGRSPTQSTWWLASGPEQTKPFDPAALRNVMPVGGTSMRTCGRFDGSVASVPPLTATMVYVSCRPRVAGSGLSVIDATARSRPTLEPVSDVVTVAWSLSALFSSWQTFPFLQASLVWSASAGVSDFAVLAIGSDASPSIVTWIVICADAPTSNPS